MKLLPVMGAWDSVPSRSNELRCDILQELLCERKGFVGTDHEQRSSTSD